ncbi:MAG: ribonuclease R [Proteobacteria bacterium]|nr:ribonuclease R [Pseudomonadota bacterium]
MTSRNNRFGRRRARHSDAPAAGHKPRGKGAGPRQGRSPQPATSGAAVSRKAAALVSAAHRSTAGAVTPLKPGASVEGTVSAHRAGYGFVRVDGAREGVFLPPPQMRGVMHGDRVRVKVSRDASDRWSGVIERVLERGVTAFLATVEFQGRSAWVVAADRRLQLRCAVAPADLHGAGSGDWVIARVTRHAGPATAAQAVVEKRLDPDRPVDLATESAIARFGLPQEFPAAALREAQACGTEVDPQETASRVDLRPLPLVTIDGEDARDFDDAVYAEAHAQGFRLIVAIADVSHYVRPGMALDSEAQARGTSVYFPTRVLPMLPTALSDHLCSLAPHVDRLCFAADMIVSRNGALRSATFYPAVMRSAARLTYTLASQALFEGLPAARTQLGHLLQPLGVLVDVYRALYKARTRRGALDFDAAEASFVISDERVRAVELKTRNHAHRLIEECMILANVAVAQALQVGRTPTLYRVHGQPEDEKLERLTSTLAALGVEAHLPQSVTTRDLQGIARRVGNAPERAFIESLVVRAMPQAVYQPANIGHFGLALTHYAHFTSPIRRYPDLVVHRTLKAMINARGGAAVRYTEGELSALGESTSRLEKRADEADRYVDNFLKCTYLKERIGQTFEGLITTVVEFGCFVQILDVAVDGLLHLDNLRDDDYVMEDDGHAWVGERSGRRLRTGSHLRVIVTAVNPIEGLVDLSLVPEVPGAREPRLTGRSKRSR